MVSIFRGPQKTFSEILEAHRGLGPGFDLLRLGLALSIVASHCSALSGNKGFLSHLILDIMNFLFPQAGAAAPALPPDSIVNAGIAAEVKGVSGPARPYTLCRVPMFFALSGFLVSGSAFRTRKIVPFLGLRVIRILPALFVEVTLSAIILGGIFTTLTASDYYTSPEFFAYFLNILGNVHYTLPGVFREHNVAPTVNGNLWTLPAEFYAYAITACLMLSGLVFNRKIFSIIFLICTIPLLIGNFLYGYGENHLGLDGNVSVYYFFMGVLFYLWRDKIPYRASYFVIALVAAYVLMMSNHTVYVYPAILTYITLFIGLSALPQIGFLKTGDYSYGVYLYGYPITQSLVAAIPAVRGNLFLLLGLTVFFTALFSFLSWHLIEKRFLFFKRYLSPRSAQISAELHPKASLTNSSESAAPEPVAGSSMRRHP